MCSRMPVPTASSAPLHTGTASGGSPLAARLMNESTKLPKAYAAVQRTMPCLTSSATQARLSAVVPTP